MNKIMIVVSALCVFTLLTLTEPVEAIHFGGEPFLKKVDSDRLSNNENRGLGRPKDYKLAQALEAFSKKVGPKKK